MGQGGRGARIGVLALLLTGLCLPGGAQAARECAEPGATWATATPAQAGMDGGEVDLALHAYQDRRAYAVRIYRHGCLISRDTVLGSETTQHDGWEMTSSVLGLVALRQMAQGLLVPDDLVGAFVPEADAAHGAITIRALLERRSGLAPGSDNRFGEHLFRHALASPVRAPASFGDGPRARDLLVAVLERAAGEDVQAYAARELFAPLGVRSFSWERDAAGQTRSNTGLRLTADDMGRLAELVRRHGTWRGVRLLRATDVDAMLRPSGSPCHGWVTWLNADTGCQGTARRLLPGLPADLWSWRGRYDQRVVVIPHLQLVVVRYGTTGGDPRSGVDRSIWERGVLQRLIDAVRDQTPRTTPGGTTVPPDTEDAWADDVTARTAPAPAVPRPGPRRTRVPTVELVRAAARSRRLVGVSIGCPAVGGLPCSGRLELVGAAARPRSWAVAPGRSRTVLLRLDERPRAPVDATVVVFADDEGPGIRTELPVRLSG